MPELFKDLASYRGIGRYELLPFRFHVLNENREVLVNELGDFLVCPRGTANRIVERRVEPTEALFEDLVGGFFITPESPPPLLEVMAARYRARKGFLDSFTGLHIFVVTLRCNLSCHYCQVSRKTKDRSRYDMSLDTLDRALDLAFRSPSVELTIEFQGGEPLVAFDIIQYAVEGALRRNRDGRRRIKFVICSNLSLIDAGILEFCRYHGIFLSTSLDGPDALHDANRPGSTGARSTTVRANIELAQSALGMDRVAALMTTSKASLDAPEQIIDAYRERGFKRIFLRPIQPFGFAARLNERLLYGAEEFITFYKRALTYILALNREGEVFAEDFAAILLRKMFSPFPTGYVDLQSPTGLVSSVVAYNYDGGVYASDEARMLAETGDHSFRLGSVTDSYESLFYGETARGVVNAGVNESLAGCADCGLQAYCGTDVVRNWAQTGDLEGHRPTSSYCRINMAVIEFLFELLDTDRDAERILRTWAS